MTLNFRISLDLFGLVTFGTNYGLQTADKAIKGCTKMALRYFGALPSKHRLETMIDNLVFFSKNFILQNAPGTKANRLRSGEMNAVEMKRGIFFLNHAWLMRAECGGAEYCWNVHGLLPKCLSDQGFNTVSIYFDPTVDENERGATIDHYGGPHHYHRRRLSSGGHSQA